MTSSDVHARKQALLLRIQTEGAEAAYEAALAVCQDTKAPAPARATCATTILRAGGYLATKESGGPAKEPHEMTADELEEQIQALKAQRLSSPPEDGGAFG